MEAHCASNYGTGEDYYYCCAASAVETKVRQVKLKVGQVKQARNSPFTLELVLAKAQFHSQNSPTDRRPPVGNRSRKVIRIMIFSVSLLGSLKSSALLYNKRRSFFSYLTAK